MLKNIFRFSSFFIFTMFLASVTIFSGIKPVVASQIATDIKADNPMGIVIEESSETLDDSKTSAAPDLGDDQAFPFIPGFGKNSGKD